MLNLPRKERPQVPTRRGLDIKAMTGISMEAVPRKTTIRDVARAAAVGVGTISRVLNSSTQVSGETRARVLEAIRRLGFLPIAQARRLLNRRTTIVCFLHRIRS